MRGTLRMGDVVHVDTVLMESIRPGDVIVYTSPSFPQSRTIHRVKRITSGGFVTQGDNSPHPDPQPVTGETLHGRVICIERHGTRRRISGGRRGQLHASSLHTLRRIRFLLSPISHPVYAVLGGWIIMLFRWAPNVQRIRISTDSGAVLKYVHREKTVAYWRQQTDEWDCLKPYDLVLEKPTNGAAK